MDLSPITQRLVGNRCNNSNIAYNQNLIAGRRRRQSLYCHEVSKQVYSLLKYCIQFNIQNPEFLAETFWLTVQVEEQDGQNIKYTVIV